MPTARVDATLTGREMDPHQVQQQLLQKFSQTNAASASPLDGLSSSQPNPSLYHPSRQSPSAAHPPRHVEIRESPGMPQQYFANEEYREHMRRQSIHAAIAAVPTTIFNQPSPQGSTPSPGPMLFPHSIHDQHLSHHTSASGLGQLGQSPLDTGLGSQHHQYPGDSAHSPGGLASLSDGALESIQQKEKTLPVITTGVSGATGITPMRDGEGKFPCPSCNKTYLHAKHLKRHLLRHTGDRPYQCVICKDTFSRSDILKRHFQKCTLRNGNPTGASHLAYSDQHKSRKAAAAANAVLAAKGIIPTRRGSRDVLTVQVSPCTSCATEGLQCSKGTPCDQCSNAGRQCKYTYVRRTASAANVRGSLPPVEFGSFGDVSSNSPQMGKGYTPSYAFPHPQSHEQGTGIHLTGPMGHGHPGNHGQHPDDPNSKYDWDMLFGEVNSSTTTQMTDANLYPVD